MITSTISNGSRSVVTCDQDNSFYSFLVLNNGETVTSKTADHSTKAGATRWAKKVLGL